MLFSQRLTRRNNNTYRPNYQILSGKPEAVGLSAIITHPLRGAAVDATKNVNRSSSRDRNERRPVAQDWVGTEP